MAQLHVLMGADTIRARPTVRRIGLADLKDALARGLADFSAIPTHAVFLCLIYPIVGRYGGKIGEAACQRVLEIRETDAADRRTRADRIRPHENM